MCLLCIEFQKQNMTVREGWRAYGEMVEGLDAEHAKEVRKMLEEAEEEEKKKAEEEQEMLLINPGHTN